jgi:D-3-phosphoglycerate dehydrogenase
MLTVIYLGGAEGAEAAALTLDGVAELHIVEADSARVAKALATADALLDASMKVRITGQMIESAQRLKIISCATTGSDHVDINALSERGIPIRTLKEDSEFLRNITPAAELSWALLMACARRLPSAVAHVNSGQWERELFPGIMLNGRTLGLIGCGRIGGWMARYANAFGMSVQAFDPYQKDLPSGVRATSLPALMANSDAISVHVHLSEETRGLVSRGLFEQVKQGAIFINTSRGAVTDESALLYALRTGRLGAAGLDVLDGEPDINFHPLVIYARDHDNLIITPHCGGFSPDAVRRVCAHAAGKIKAVLEA